jgi:folate-binding protein YgfZ
VGRELSAEYIPLEVGLWDEVNFHKGCYTGQEIIARMESRNKLARTLVSLKLTEPVDAPVDLYHESRNVGRLTSSVSAPDGEVFAMAVIKSSLARPGVQLRVASAGGSPAEVERLLGVQPAWIAANNEDG